MLVSFFYTDKFHTVSEAWTFKTLHNGYRCLALAILENVIVDFLKFNPKNPAMVAFSKRAERNNTSKSHYRALCQYYEQAHDYLFIDSDKGVNEFLRDSRYKVYQLRRNALKRLRDLQDIGWEGYSNRSKERTQTKGGENDKDYYTSTFSCYLNRLYIEGCQIK
jgi:hypothetical protein